MSFYTTAVAQLATEHLQSLLDDNAVENARLEFKLEVASKDETLKKISSFANAFGGSIIIGARANSSDGRLTDLPGVAAQPGYKQTIVQWCFDAISPPLITEVSDPIPVPAGGGKVCYVIRTGESDVAPHFLNGRKGIYVRTDEFSGRFEARLANEMELRHLFDRRRIVRERRSGLVTRARNRFTNYARRKFGSSESDHRTGGPRLDISIGPRFPASPLCDHGALVQFVMREAITWRQTRFPRLSGDIITQHESAILLQAAEDFSLFEANIWGMTFYGTQIDITDEGAAGIHTYQVAGYILAALRHAAHLLNFFGYQGLVVVEVSMASILGVPWLTGRNGFGQSGTASELDDDVTFSVVTSTDAMALQSANTPASHEVGRNLDTAVLRTAFYAVNLARFVDTDQSVDALRRQAYQYNYWRYQ
jgi:hypothetical protein